jgi:hypothetical protein
MYELLAAIGLALAFVGGAMGLPRRDRALQDRWRRKNLSPLEERIERLAENPFAWWATLIGCLLSIIGIVGFFLR